MMHTLAPVTDLLDVSQEILAEEKPSLPVSVDLKTVFLGGLFTLATLTSLYVARDIAMPIVLAFVFKLVLLPILRLLKKLHFPQTLASIIILVVLCSGIVVIGTALSTPAAMWVEKFSDNLPKIQDRIGFVSRPLAQAQKFMGRAEDLTKGIGPKVMPVSVQGTRLSDKALAEVQNFAGELFATMLILFFLLVSGDTFLRRLVEILPRFKDKRQAVDISQQIEQDISGYLLTITMMNAGLGIATGIVVKLTGLGDPMLWGTLAFLLNYIPIIGPIIGVGILLIAGLIADIDGAALMPASLYFLIHIIEGTMITPLLLAKRFTLNPVLVILSLVFWFWMWGIPGAILAMPMLAITKIICDRIQSLMAFGHFLEG